MSMVIPLPAPAYPATTDGLNAAESAFLLALRWWVADYRHRVDPMPRLREVMHCAGPRDAAICVDQLMTLIAHTARAPVGIQCPQCRHLTHDEKLLLHAASLVQAGDGGLAGRLLRIDLLPAAAATFALGVLAELAELFSDAGLGFRRRRMPDDMPTPCEASTSPAWSRALH
ncbi:conserved protein of unknown function [Rhodovastum atsumiense]|uniref:Uncharacterized protein n=1 Tax=Rhodovastum atsumiense TaxID=504468 RepID=A0A5M6IZZ4_9PROT|nr:hypothetical protein [Rhodovastum atsumiense]KAA5613841.1 hypothetical protein F1189_03440 [Rhodovastum atsumiense]CAH2601951.1 conserved protein of unknown function [Rhodovastum atsumiense]